MSLTIASLLTLTFAVSFLALAVLLWAVWRQHMKFGAAAATVIFEPGEVGRPEEPAAKTPDAEQRIAPVDRGSVSKELAEDLAARDAADRSTRDVVRLFFVSGTAWLVLGSILGLTASLKMTFPDWLTGQAWLTFGRIRPMHLNAVIYGWASMAGIGTVLWLLPRLLRSPLKAQIVAIFGGWLWNAGVAIGLVSIAVGWTDGLEWLEFPWPVDAFFVIGGALVAVPLFVTVRYRRVSSLYVSVWYIAAALVWFPVLFLVANQPYVHFGVEHAVVNWWYAHNVLGLWLTPLGLAAAYYFIPKVLGKPIYSYSLSLIGFWALALFYSQAGIHHLIGGPVPTWLVTLSIVQSVMMVIPVIAVAVNHHVTMVGNFSALKHSPTLRFVVTGAIMYTGVSLQGSLHAVREVNQVTHFTHFTVGHAHMGVYAFYSFIIFGAAYFLLPRVFGRDWPRPRLISIHFWTALGGILIYMISLMVGGVFQGLAQLDASRPFMESVTLTIPYLHARTVGGTLMTLSHFIFAWHVALLVAKKGPMREGAPWQRNPSKQEVTA